MQDIGPDTACQACLIAASLVVLNGHNFKLLWQMHLLQVCATQGSSLTRGTTLVAQLTDKAAIEDKRRSICQQIRHVTSRDQC